MKLRITEDTIRLRLSEQECKELSDLKTLTNTCSFPGGERLIYSLAIDKALHVALEANQIFFSITEDQVQVIIQKGTVSTSFSNKDQAMKLILEQDMKVRS